LDLFLPVNLSRQFSSHSIIIAKTSRLPSFRRVLLVIGAPTETPILGHFVSFWPYRILCQRINHAQLGFARR
jgi:hypothetical protein